MLAGASGKVVAAGEQHPLRVLAVLSALMAFGSISTDFYLPAIPAMVDALYADTGTLELTISSYLVGFSVGQLFWGLIADRYGRRGPVVVLVLPPGHLIIVVAAASLGFLDLLGAIGGRAGAANVWRATWRVTFRGALAMGLTAGVGMVGGTVV